MGVLSHINKEIEKSMRSVEMFTVPASSLASVMFNDQSKWSVNMNSDPTSVTLPNSKYSDSFKHLNSVSRISQVIEDSVRGPRPQSVEGPDPSETKQVPEKPRKTIVPNETQRIEGLASRFEELRKSKSHPGSQAVKETNNAITTKAKNRKHFDSKDTDSSQSSQNQKSEYKEPSGDESLELQQEITSGFDRLVALASEVDKRRKSGDANAVEPNCVPNPSQLVSGVSLSTPSTSQLRHFKKKYFEQELQKRKDNFNKK